MSRPATSTAIAPAVLEKVLPEMREAFVRFAESTLEKIERVAQNQGQRSRITGIWRHAGQALVTQGNLHKLRALQLMNKTPVTIDEFVESPEFFGELQSVWPRLRPDIRAMNPDVFMGETPVFEALLGGATGTGKTTLCYTTNAYQLYLLSCFTTPQLIYGLSSVTPIVFMFQSVSQTVTRRVVYKPFRDLFTAMPYTKRWLAWNKYRESDLQLAGNLHVVPALANLDAILGQAIAGCMLDEVNFMRVIQNSTQVAGTRGQGGKFDQAKEIYTNITRRRQRSFQTKSYSMGVLCVLSSTRYKNDFLDQRMRQVREYGLANILPIRRKQYEVLPQERFSGETFRLLIGSEEWGTRILEDHEVAGEHYSVRGTVENVPIEYLDKFKVDPEGSLRDIIGIATDAIAPFMTQRHKIVEAIQRFKEASRRNFAVKNEVDLAEGGFAQWNDDVLRTLSEVDKARPRWVHIDLSLANDACGVSVVSFMGMTARLDENTDKVELAPLFSVDAAVQIKPSSERHIDIAEVRRWVMQLATYYGLNLYEVTYDGFQSAESMGVLRRSGIRSRLVSLDRSNEPYEEVRRAYYEDRIMSVDSETLKLELATLEYNEKTLKIDHPPSGSKDVADAVAGAITAARTSRIIRNQIRQIDEGGENTKSRARAHRPRGSQYTAPPPKPDLPANGSIRPRGVRPAEIKRR